MSDEKPTLEYGRPGTLPNGWVIDVILCVVLATIGLVCLLVTGFWIWNTLADEDLRHIGSDLLQAVISTIGLLLLLTAWKIQKRIRRS